MEEDSIIKEGETISHYKYKDLPWVNKSRLGAFDFCEFSAWLGEQKQQQAKPLDQEMEGVTVMGTNAHLVISMFPKVVRDRDLIKDFMKMPIEVDPKNSQLYWAFYSICEEIMPKEARTVPEFMVVIGNYCQWQVDNWIAVSKMVGTTEESYKKFWLPKHAEVYLMIEDEKYFGTLDAVYNNPNKERDGIPYIITEFKSREAPKSVRDYKGQDAFSVKLPTSKMEELHFEAYLAANGKIPKMKRTCPSITCLDVVLVKETEETWKAQYPNTGYQAWGGWRCPQCHAAVDENNIKWQTLMVKALPLANTYKDFIAAIVYLGGEYPFTAPKTMNARTMSNVHRNAQVLRDKWANHRSDPSAWEKKLNDFICPKCMNGAECSEIQMKNMMEAERRAD